QLPGNDVAVMLELGKKHPATAILRKHPRNEVDRFGRAASEDELIGPSADQLRGSGTCLLIARRHRRRTLVNTAMHRRIIARIGLRDRIDHRLRFLRSRGAVEIVPALDRRELVADVERRVDAGGRVQAILLKASRAASWMASGSFALSHR